MRTTTPLRPLALALILTGGLAACAAPVAPPAKPVVVKSTPKKSAAKLVKVPAPKPGIPAEPVGPMPQPAAEAEAGPLDLVGRSEKDVLSLLGAPASESANSPGKVLAFAGAGCAFEVHLFPDVKQGGYRVLELVQRPGQLAPSQCAGRIRSMRS